MSSPVKRNADMPTRTADLLLPQKIFRFFGVPASHSHIRFVKSAVLRLVYYLRKKSETMFPFRSFLELVGGLEPPTC